MNSVTGRKQANKTKRLELFRKVVGEPGGIMESIHALREEWL